MSVNITILNIEGFVTKTASECSAGFQVVGSITGLDSNIIHRLEVIDQLPLGKTFADEVLPAFYTIPKGVSQYSFAFDLRLQQSRFHTFKLSLKNAENLSASPIAEEINLFGSLVSVLAKIVNVICPGDNNFKPFSLEIILQCGGKMLETVTILHI